MADNFKTKANLLEMFLKLLFTFHGLSFGRFPMSQSNLIEILCGLQGRHVFVVVRNCQLLLYEICILIYFTTENKVN